MKKIAIFLFLIFFINIFSIKIGIYENTPYVINDNKGIVVEILNYIQKNYDINIEKVMGTQPGLMKKLKLGEIDALALLGETKERREFGKFNKISFFTEWGIAYSYKDVDIITLEDLKDKDIGVMDTDIFYEGEYGIKNILNNFGINVSFIEYQSYKDILDDLNKGKISVGVVNRLYDVRDYKNIKRTSVLFSPVEFKILFRKNLNNVDSIINTFDKAFEDIINDENSIYYKILDEYTVSQQTVLPDSFVFNIIITLIVIFIIIISLYLLIVYMRRTIKKKTKESKKLNEKLFQMINLVSKIGSDSIEINEFYHDLLKGAVNIIDEAESGSISLFEHNDWKYITAYGHDEENLTKMNLKKEYRLPVEDTKIYTYEEIMNLDKNLMPENIRKLFKKYTVPFKQMMVSRINVNESISMDFSIEIPMKSDKNFTEESKIIFKSLVSLSKTFMFNKINFNTVRNAYVNFAKKLSMVAEEFDDETGEHIQRVGELSAFVAEKLGMNSNYIKDIREFAPLHDIGKIFIPKEILKKPGKLSHKEWKTIKKHTSFSYKLLGEDEYFKMALNISLYHHEKYNGGGYPFNIKGDQIPLEAQIVSLVDVYDALRSKRAYKPAFSHKKTMDIILNGDQRTKSNDFNPEILDIFKKYSEEIEELYNEF